MTSRRALLLVGFAALSGCAAIFGLDPLELGGGSTNADAASELDGSIDGALAADGAEGDSGDQDGTTSVDGGPGDGSASDGAPTLDGSPVDATSFAFAIDENRALFKYVPGSTNATQIVQLSANCITSGSDDIVDLAMAADGTVYAYSTTRLLRVNPVTGQCTPVKSYDAGAVFPWTIAFVNAQAIDAAAPDGSVLVGYTSEDFFHVDTTTGEVVKRGSMSADGGITGYRLAGDIVSLGDLANRTFVAVHKKSEVATANDYLAEIDPKTGAITNIVGKTSKTNIVGLAYWAGQLYGFVVDGSIVRVDINNGATPLLASTTKVWMGAGGTPNGAPPL